MIKKRTVGNDAITIIHPMMAFIDKIEFILERVEKYMNVLLCKNGN